MVQIYFAAPLFNDAELIFNKKLAEQLEGVGFTVYLPQEGEDKPSVDNVTKTDLKKIYQLDIEHLIEADIIVAVADGADMDSGTAYEVGYAVALKKPVYILRTDIRMQNNSEYVNLMIQEGADEIFLSVDTMIQELHKKYSGGHTV